MVLEKLCSGKLIQTKFHNRLWRDNNLMLHRMVNPNLFPCTALSNVFWGEKLLAICKYRGVRVRLFNIVIFHKHDLRLGLFDSSTRLVTAWWGECFSCVRNGDEVLVSPFKAVWNFGGFTQKSRDPTLGTVCPPHRTSHPIYNIIFRISMYW